MRRILCLIGAVVLCGLLACPAFAAENIFVPSIGEKDGPKIEEAIANGEKVDSCLVITSIKAALEKRTDITQEERDLLLELYDQLESGTMKLPLEYNYVIREIVDLSYVHTGCIQEDHDHQEWIDQKNTTMKARMYLGVGRNVKVDVLVYVDGEWLPVESVVNNGDGSVTCVFEHIGPVVFCVSAEDAPAKTGDAYITQLPLWIALMVGSLLALIAVVVLYRRSAR